jgi:hypothetical protein
MHPESQVAQIICSYHDHTVDVEAVLANELREVFCQDHFFQILRSGL